MLNYISQWRNYEKNHARSFNNVIANKAIAWTAGIAIKFENSKLSITINLTNIDVIRYTYFQKTDDAEFRIIFKGETVGWLTLVRLNSRNEAKDIEYQYTNKEKGQKEIAHYSKKNPKNKSLYQDAQKTVDQILRMRSVDKALKKYKKKIIQSR